MAKESELIPREFSWLLRATDSVQLSQLQSKTGWDRIGKTGTWIGRTVRVQFQISCSICSFSLLTMSKSHHALFGLDSTPVSRFNTFTWPFIYHQKSPLCRKHQNQVSGFKIPLSSPYPYSPAYLLATCFGGKTLIRVTKRYLKFELSFLIDTRPKLAKSWPNRYCSGQNVQLHFF